MSALVAMTNTVLLFQYIRSLSTPLSHTSASIMLLTLVVIGCSKEVEPVGVERLVETEVPVETGLEKEEVEITAMPTEVVAVREVVRIVEVPVEIVVERKVVREVEVPVEVVVEVVKEVEVPVEVVVEVVKEEASARIIEEKDEVAKPEVLTGLEMARLTHKGETYTLVEYDSKIVVFSESGSPVTSPRLADDVLRSYAWGEVLEGFDRYGMQDALEVVQDFDYSMSGIRDTTGDVVNMLDQLEALSADVPLLGRVSAMDVISFTYEEVDLAETAIRSLHADLNSLGGNSYELGEAIDRISEIEPSEVSGGQVEDLFGTAAKTSRDMQARVVSAKDKISDVRDFAGALENAMRQTSDTPIIGETLAESAETAGEFESTLSDFTDELRSVENELDFLADEFQGTRNAGDRAHQEYMERWLQNPPSGRN